MATVTLNPNVSTYTPGDPPITVSISGGSSPDFYWESNNGSFANRYVNNTLFTPFNGTAATSIKGRKVLSRSALNLNTSGGSISAYSPYWGFTKTSASSANWDVSSTSNTGIPNGTLGFFEFTAVENNTEKAAGLTTNGSIIDPTNAGYNLAWHLSANGTAVPRKAGVALATIHSYQSGDVFRIAIESGRTAFYLNGNLVVSTTTPGGTLHGTLSFKTSGATINGGTVFLDPATNEAVRTLSVVSSFPVQPNYSYDLTTDNNTLVSIAEDGSGTYRKKGNSKKVMSLQFIERPYSEYVALKNFWDAHEKHETFVYDDLVFGETYIMRFESGFRTVILGPDNITIQVTLREA